jgi:Protein of unknown function (DUF4239)
MPVFDHPRALFLVLLVVLLAAVEIGQRIGMRMSVDSDSLRHEQLVAARDAIEFLLSLLLGFTLAMAISRFDQRKQLLVDEANSIGTTALRAQMLPESVSNKMLELLREYVDARVRFSSAKLNAPELLQSIATTKRLQNQMWEQSVVASKLAPNTITSAFIQSLNESIDLSEKRLSTLENRVPPSLWIALTLISVLACVTVGMTVRRRFWYVMAITPLIIAIVMGLISDLNNPRAGFLQTGRQSMDRLQQDLNLQTNAK